MDDLLKIDITMIIQFVNSIIALLVLNFVLIRPVRAQLKARKDITDGITSEINVFNAKAKEKLTSYEQALAETRTAAAKEREATRAEAMRKEAEMIAEAYKNSQEFLADFRARMAREARDATEELRRRSSQFADMAINKLLN